MINDGVIFFIRNEHFFRNYDSPYFEYKRDYGLNMAEIVSCVTSQDCQSARADITLFRGRGNNHLEPIKGTQNLITSVTTS